jgi:hypothetical protein
MISRRPRPASLATSIGAQLSVAAIAATPAGALASPSAVTNSASHWHSRQCRRSHQHRCKHARLKPNHMVVKPAPPVVKPAPPVVKPALPVTGPGSPHLTPAEEQAAVEPLMQAPSEPGLYGGGGGCKC